MKWIVLLLGFLNVGVIIAQLTMGLLIASRHDPRLIKIHQHFGYATVAFVLAYTVISMIVIASSSTLRKTEEERSGHVD